MGIKSAALRIKPNRPHRVAAKRLTKRQARRLCRTGHQHEVYVDAFTLLFQLNERAAKQGRSIAIPNTARYISDNSHD